VSAAWPLDELLNAFVDGELGAKDRRELERRVVEDRALRRRVRELRLLRKLVRLAYAEHLPARRPRVRRSRGHSR
jgi:anti-sigma factor RsiW